MGTFVITEVCRDGQISAIDFCRGDGAKATYEVQNELVAITAHRFREYMASELYRDCRSRFW